MPQLGQPFVSLAVLKDLSDDSKILVKDTSESDALKEQVAQLQAQIEQLTLGNAPAKRTRKAAPSDTEPEPEAESSDEVHAGEAAE